MIVTQFVMGAAVKISPVAVFAVVILGTAVAGIAGAIFAIPTAAAILAITDYLRQRDVLLRAADPPAIGLALRADRGPARPSRDRAPGPAGPSRGLAAGPAAPA